MSNALRCLVCLLPAELHYHPACAMELFGIPDVPNLFVDLAHLEAEGWKMAGKLSISGLQPKLSMRLSASGDTLETVGTKGEFILKPQSPKYRSLPENEHVTMRLAHAAGIEVPPCGLVNLADDSLAFLVRRYDRLCNPPRKLLQEDFCALAELPRDAKERGSAELCVRLLRKYATQPAAEIPKLFRQLAFSYVCGNGDLHLKNLSLLTDVDGIRRLSPAYDLLCTRLVMPQDRTTLPVGGKRDPIHRGTWLKFAEYCGMKLEGAQQILKVLSELPPMAQTLLAGSPLSQEMKQKYLQLLELRCSGLTQG